MEELAHKNFGSATEIANYLVRVHDVPFRQAHHIVGSFVGEMSRQGRSLEGCEPDLLAHLQRNGVPTATADDCAQMIDPKAIVRSYESFGGTGPKAVAAASRNLQQRLSDERVRLASDKAQVEDAYKRCLHIARSAAHQPEETAAGLQRMIDSTMLVNAGMASMF